MATKKPAPRRFAEDTQVSEAKSREEIEKLVKRFGATGFQTGWRGRTAAVGFEISGRAIRILLPLADPTEERRDSAGRLRSEKGLAAALEKEDRRRWRALALVLKAKLEAVASGIVTMESEFLPYVVMPDGQTLYERYGPQLEERYRRGDFPAMLPGLPAAGEDR